MPGTAAGCQRRLSLWALFSRYTTTDVHFIAQTRLLASAPGLIVIPFSGCLSMYACGLWGPCNHAGRSLGTRLSGHAVSPVSAVLALSRLQWLRDCTLWMFRGCLVVFTAALHAQNGVGGWLMLTAVVSFQVTPPTTDAAAASVVDSARQLETELDRLWRLDTSILRWALGLDATPLNAAWCCIAAAA